MWTLFAMRLPLDVWLIIFSFVDLPPSHICAILCSCPRLQSTCARALTQRTLSEGIWSTFVAEDIRYVRKYTVCCCDKHVQQIVAVTCNPSQLVDQARLIGLSCPYVDSLPVETHNELIKFAAFTLEKEDLVRRNVEKTHTRALSIVRQS